MAVKSLKVRQQSDVYIFAVQGDKMFSSLYGLQMLLPLHYNPSCLL